MKPIEQDIVFYDGLCGFCNGSVRFLMKRDKLNRLVFSPLQGETAKQALHASGLPDSLVVLTAGEGGTLMVRSAACLYLGQWLGQPYKALVVFARIFPVSWLDRIYDFVARHRMKIFGRYDSCPIPPPGYEKKFLP
jgi:predicted DCC family thiol-disulfide oxidoreductase YuxK